MKEIDAIDQNIIFRRKSFMLQKLFLQQCQYVIDLIYVLYPRAFVSVTVNIVEEVLVGQRKHLQTRLMLKEGRM